MMHFIHALLRLSGGRVEAMFVPRCTRVTRMDERQEREPDGKPPAAGAAGQRLAAAGPMSRLKNWARALKRDIVALSLAARDPRTPWYAKALALGVAAYALSPIDLIPDFIPVLGYLDDLILLPAGIALAIHLIPAEVMKDCRERAEQLERRPRSRVAAAVIATVWLGLVALVGVWVWRQAS